MKRYYLYLGLLIISLLGTDLTDFTLAIWILDQPGVPVSSYTLTWFFEAAPAVLLSVFIGSFVDRWDKRKMIIYGQLAAGIGSIVLLILYWQELLVPWHIMLVAGVGSISSMFVFQSFFVATKSFVATKDLVRAQALVSMCYGILKIGVPVLAPIFYKLIGLGNVFFIDIISFTVSIVGFVLLGAIAAKKTNEPLNIRNDIRLVKEFIFNKVGFLYLLPFSFLSQFFLALVAVLFAPLLLDFSNEYTLGIIYACLGIGGIIGSGLMSLNKSNTFIRPTNKVITIHAIVGFIIMGFAISVNPYFIGTLGILVAILFSISTPLYNSIILTTIPEDLLGRFSGVVGLFVGIGAPLAFLFSGFLVDILSELLKDSTYMNFYPGSIVTLSIVVLFTIMGLFLMILSLIFRSLKGIRVLDDLYIKELNKNVKTVKND
ncbi:MFS transporter [uncultured Aquimarina sp.]|uniref:MFS transporter n=1 Tax=uncultured Aquimarina sp. TaxID=575652 RepID=UPI00261139A4|nr:MFS transporter [uncultured Aquimarina sp.]